MVYIVGVSEIGKQCMLAGKKGMLKKRGNKPSTSMACSSSSEYHIATLA
jgi:hypothetical protein